MASLGGTPNDYWWLKPSQPDNPLPAMALGARIRQDAQQMVLQQQQMKMAQERQSFLMQEAMNKQMLQTKLMAGSAELSKLGAKVTDWSDPSVRSGLLEFTTKYPLMADTDVFKTMAKWHTEAVNAKTQLEKDKNTATMSELAQADTWDQQAGTIEAIDPDRAKQLRTNAALIRSKFTAPTESIVTGVDEQGRPTVSITRGPNAGKAPSALTTATQGQLQQRAIGFEKTMNTASQLLGKLTPDMVGVRGLLGDVVVDNTLAQQFPELANKDRIDGRTLLRVFNESIIKTLKVDAQVNRDEEKRLLAALPDAGAITSLPAAQQKIKTFMGLMRDQARIDSKAAGTPVPQWALSFDELVQKTKAGEMTKEQAYQLMDKYQIAP